MSDKKNDDTKKWDCKVTTFGGIDKIDSALLAFFSYLCAEVFRIMVISSAKFVVSNSDWRECPSSSLPEYAFIGRSNVGKSTLINRLTSKHELAKTSSKPGKTLLINHFLINDTWHLVDLPGYGYAQTGREQRARLRAMIEGYVLHRAELVNLFVLVDSRLEPQRIDLEFMQWLGENEVPFAIVFTKSDKLSPSRLKANVAAYKEKLLETWEELPPVFVTSSETGYGRTELLGYIDELNQLPPSAE